MRCHWGRTICTHHHCPSPSRVWGSASKATTKKPHAFALRGRRGSEIDVNVYNPYTSIFKSVYLILSKYDLYNRCHTTGTIKFLIEISNVRRINNHLSLSPNRSFFMESGMFILYRTWSGIPRIFLISSLPLIIIVFFEGDFSCPIVFKFFPWSELFPIELFLELNVGFP